MEYQKFTRANPKYSDIYMPIKKGGSSSMKVVLCQMCRTEISGSDFLVNKIIECPNCGASLADQVQLSRTGDREAQKVRAIEAVARENNINLKTSSGYQYAIGLAAEKNPKLFRQR